MMTQDEGSAVNLQRSHRTASRPVGIGKVTYSCFDIGLTMVVLMLAASAVRAAADDEGVPPKDASGRILNLDFEEGTLRDWTAEGRAFAGQPVKGDTVAPRRADMKSGHQGEYWVGGYERHGDAPVGTLTSAKFEVTEPWATFLIGGGQQPETRVELVRAENGEVFYEAVGKTQENLHRVVVDLREHVGQEIFVRLVDEHSGGWGHLNFDYFRLHAQQPGDVTPQLTRSVPQSFVHTGVSADEAAKAMTLPDGFSVVVSAAEPDVQQPVAMALDDRGRVWVAEAYEYPRRAPEGQGRDRILIFEDENGDGRFDKRKVFAEALNLVSGLEVGFGGVWVGAAPYLLFIPDRNRDDVPDGEPEVLLDGWGYQDTHETLNAFIWGPDGWLYGCHGVFTHSRVGKPGTPDEARIPVNAAIWRYHPTRHEFDVFAHGTSNPWGVDFNDRGQCFLTACVIPHLYHVIQGGRYQRQGGTHFNVHTYDDIKTIADHLHYAGDIRDHAHWGHEPSVPEHVVAAGGGHAHSGAMFYLGGTWPAEYRDRLFMNNIHGARLNVDIPVPQGSGYIGRHGEDFLVANDSSSQILNFRYGPDGNVTFIDWYDANQCHRNEIETHDRTNGRVYKTIYGEPNPVDVDLQELTNLELAELVLHENDWYVRHARRILQERTAGVARPESSKGVEQTLAPARARLAEIAATHSDETRRLRAMWALHVTGGLTGEQLDRALADESSYVRGWVVQLSIDGAGAVSEQLLAQFVAMARDDASPIVRLYLASAAQRLPLESRWSLVEGLASHAEDATDHNLPLMIWYAAEPLADVNAERALTWGLGAGENIPILRDFMLRRIGSADTRQSLALLTRGLGKATDPGLQLTFLRGIRAALAGQRRVEPPADWSTVSAKLMQGDHREVQLQTMSLGVTFGDPWAIEMLRSVAAGASSSHERRIALESLLAAGNREIVPIFQTLIYHQELSDLAIKSLAQYDDPRTALLLLQGYANFPPNDKRAALATLASRASYAMELLRAVERNEIAGTDLTADLVRQIEYLNNPEVTALLKRVWGSVRETEADKAAAIADFKSLLTSVPPTEPDPSLGRAVFARTCQQCHTLYGVGQNVGPDLTGSNRADLEYLLSNIVDPSAVMAKEYQPSIFYTLSGRVVTGIVRAEDSRSVTVQTEAETLIIPKDEIDERVVSEMSMMPDNQLQQFSEDEIRSLVAYLQTREQAPLLATPDNAALLFNGRDLSGWSGDASLWLVENGEIVGRTSGLDHNEFLISDMTAENFRLELEVKLVKNAGNSGIQFRSRPLPGGEVAGYQADVGADWWGKLYEEHGRALVWDKSGEAHVRAGDWNTYVIEARDDRIRTWINGQLCVDLADPEGSRRGVFALQLHSGGATEVRFRNFKLEVFP
jgi:putative membrane-bound dehydrogenase-like protein